MCFKEVKRRVIECLENGNVIHEQRSDIDIKNLLATGDISKIEAISIIKKARGNEYKSSPHHYDSKVMVHVIETTYSGISWYIKWYFDEKNGVFISFHQ
jgi:hypothetical protein